MRKERIAICYENIKVFEAMVAHIHAIQRDYPRLRQELVQQIHRLHSQLARLDEQYKEAEKNSVEYREELEKERLLFSILLSNGGKEKRNGRGRVYYTRDKRIDKVEKLREKLQEIQKQLAEIE
jgi:hypothetical protein